MALLPQSRLWQRIDVAGAEQVFFDDRSGLRAEGTIVAAERVPCTCRYELATDPEWRTTSFLVRAEGAGWARQVRLEREHGSWRVTTEQRGTLAAELPGIEEPGRLDDAVDVDLFASPLTNTLPIRRLGLAEPGTRHEILAAWVMLPSLQVIPSKQSYTALGGGRVRYASGSFSAELTVDEQGFVRHYPGLAETGS
ncbi:putative glycolipid-binding domain-containing protein [Longispora albida]|uniref:putative glycolipid-binding domain-containing protein n=1 Tax=Longispora albida TaxID=203523 RepID=UPI000364A5E0|nr:putative glycolipid-binding domain-containing protein [Longispora albida]